MAFSQTKPSMFLVMVTGQIECGQFPDFDEVYAKYWFVMGPEWKIITGLGDGMTQFSQRSFDERQLFTFSLPLEATFQSTTPHGWPQLSMAVYGKDFMGREVVAGYGAVFVPTEPGRRTLRMGLFVPESSSYVQKFLGWVQGRKPEFFDPKLPTQNNGREVCRVRSQAWVDINFQVISKDMRAMGYEVNSDSTNRTHDTPLFSHYVTSDPTS